MDVVSVREFNSNVSKSLARVENGETFELSKNGRVFAEVRPKVVSRAGDAAWKARFDALMEDLEKGVPFGKSFDHDERNG